MEQVLLDQIIALRAQLHACAEVSGREAVTKHTLLTFLREHTSLELHELAGGFYAAHREPEGTKSTVALRADYDALATPQGGAAHLCGHDGHAAALCGVALMLEGQSIGRSVFLLFQGAEETGAGAAAPFMTEEIRRRFRSWSSTTFASIVSAATRRYTFTFFV